MACKTSFSGKFLEKYLAVRMQHANSHEKKSLITDLQSGQCNQWYPCKSVARIFQRGGGGGGGGSHYVTHRVLAWSTADVQS